MWMCYVVIQVRCDGVVMCVVLRCTVCAVLWVCDVLCCECVVPCSECHYVLWGCCAVVCCECSMPCCTVGVLWCDVLCCACDVMCYVIITLLLVWHPKMIHYFACVVRGQCSSRSVHPEQNQLLESLQVACPTATLVLGLPLYQHLHPFVIVIWFLFCYVYLVVHCTITFVLLKPTCCALGCRTVSVLWCVL